MPAGTDRYRSGRGNLDRLAVDGHKAQSMKFEFSTWGCDWHFRLCAIGLLLTYCGVCCPRGFKTTQEAASIFVGSEDMARGTDTQGQTNCKTARREAKSASQRFSRMKISKCFTRIAAVAFLGAAATAAPIIVAAPAQAACRFVLASFAVQCDPPPPPPPPPGVPPPPPPPPLPCTTEACAGFAPLG